jgi:hypothetical protein
MRRSHSSSDKERVRGVFSFSPSIGDFSSNFHSTARENLVLILAQSLLMIAGRHLETVSSPAFNLSP